eukprot:11210958-Lingulodinium_polyedra.AAC.1
MAARGRLQQSPRSEVHMLRASLPRAERSDKSMVGMQRGRRRACGHPTDEHAGGCEERVRVAGVL